MKRSLFSVLLATGCVAALGFGPVQSTASAATRIVLLAGVPSHGPGEHEHNAGCQLLAKKLNEQPGFQAEVYKNGWPTNDAVLDGAAAIFIYCDGGDGHPAIKPERLAKLGELMAKGVGLGTCHYGVEVPKGDPGNAWLKWTGGYFETFWSVNPHWDADFTSFPVHPITRGVKPFKINDEWYYHMRFPEDMKNVTPILSALPPKESLSRPDGPHSGNPAVRAAVAAGEQQHMAWAIQRPDGGRGFGYTGGHYHKNWQNDNVRKLVLNAIAWTAKLEIPAEGINTPTPTDEEMKANLDDKRKK